MVKKRVLVVDDQLVVRQLLEMYLKSGETYELAASLASASQVSTFLQSNYVDLILNSVQRKLLEVLYRDIIVLSRRRTV